MISRKILLSAFISTALLTTTAAHANSSQGMNNSWGNTGMSMDGGSMSSGGNSQSNVNNYMDQSGFEDALDSISEDSEVDTVNADSYTVDEPKVHMGKLVLTNIGEIDISSTLYVYGDMEVMNVDSFVVSGKLRVTGKLTVMNGSLELKGGTLYVGKKKFMNGGLKGKARKVNSALVKLDQYLNTEISQEEIDEIISIVKEANTEYRALSKELLLVKKQKGDILGIGEKLVQNREDLYAQLEQYIQEEDMKAFEKLEKKEIGVAKTYYRKVTGKKDI